MGIATCTAINKNTYAFVDASSSSYIYMCGGGTQGSSANTTNVANGWTDCFAQCDGMTGCTGFSFVNGAALGAGAGNCWLKTNNPQSFASTDALVSTRIGGLRRQYVSSEYEILSFGGQPRLTEYSIDLSSDDNDGYGYDF